MKISICYLFYSIENILIIQNLLILIEINNVLFWRIRLWRVFDEICLGVNVYSKINKG